MLRFFLIFFFFIMIHWNVQVKADSPDRLILINLTNNQLSYFENGKYVKNFPVSTGKRATPTPEGRFTIKDKYKNKEYHRKNISGGAYNNPLGTRWMGLNYMQYGIHGTNKEYSIGNFESDGCIRMNDRNIQWLYERIPIHTNVVIAKFHGSAERAAHHFGYLVTSWNGENVHPHQIGRIRTLAPMILYWQDLNGHLIPIRHIAKNELLSVFSYKKEGIYDVGYRTYLIDQKQNATRYEQIPDYIIVNEYKRKKEVAK